LTARAHAIIACDFLVVETVLLKRLHVLVFIEHGTRRLHLAGVTARPTAAWAVQQARNLAMDLDDRLGTMRFKSEGLRIITTLPRTPWMNATCERVIGTLRRELLDRTLILGDRHLDLVLREYVTHYDGHRPHQSRQQRPPDIDAPERRRAAGAAGRAPGDVLRLLVLRGAAPVGGGHAPGGRPAPAEDRVGADRLVGLGVPGRAGLDRRGHRPPGTRPEAPRRQRDPHHPHPPILVRLLRAHIKRFGTTPDGRIFQTARGGILQDSGPPPVS
jgi:hypothetical protein